MAVLPAGCFSFYGGFERAAGAILRENPKGSTLTLGMGTARLGKGWLASRVGLRCWGGARLVEAGMGSPRPSGRGTRMFSLSILRRWTLAPSGGLARGASWGAWLLAPSVPPCISQPSHCSFPTADGVKREGQRGCVSAGDTSLEGDTAAGVEASSAQGHAR